jgi:hypothetical protein
MIGFHARPRFVAVLPVCAAGNRRDAPCTCPDMLDLASRNNQVKAAIKTYEEQLATWTAAGEAPGADEDFAYRVSARHSRAVHGRCERLSSQHGLSRKHWQTAKRRLTRRRRAFVH